MNINIFRVEYFMCDSYRQEYYFCPLEAGARAKQLIDDNCNGERSDVTIETIRVQ
jgi:hypothetical protein